MDIAQVFIHDTSWAFAGEIILRTVIMFMMIIVFLRLTGKRGVRQLSIFEVAILLALGSIAGDPMFDEELPLLQAFIIMLVVIILYRTTTWLMMKYQPFEDLLEGKSLYIVEDGMLVLDKIKKGQMSHDEFFAEMRQQGVEHLGQVRVGLLETDGKFSILFYANEDVRYGLPLFPKASRISQTAKAGVIYACTHCGMTSELDFHRTPCPRCGCKTWTQALNSVRV